MSEKDNEFLKELSAQLIEASRWNGIEQGVVWSIEFITAQKLEWLKSSIQRKELQKIVSWAKESENFIIKSLGLDKIPKNKKLVNFSLPPLPITKKDIWDLGDFYEKIFNLYIYRNPSESKESIKSLIGKNKEIHIDFWVDLEKNKFFIRRIYIQDSVKIEGNEPKKTWNTNMPNNEIV